MSKVEEKKKPKVVKAIDEDLSEEDKELKEKIDMLVERVKDNSLEIQQAALEKIKEEVSTATSSMTSVPKPLKFLNPHYDGLKAHYEALRDGEHKKKMADLLSVLGITMSEEGTREALKFALEGTHEGLDGWGHEYLRSLSGEVINEHTHMVNEGQTTNELDFLVDVIIPHFIKHMEETEAIDLLLEVD